MQTTLLGLAIAFIIALIAALVGPYFIDWNQFRPQFEAEASRIIGAPVRVSGELDARLLPAPSLRLRSVALGGANDLGKIRAGKLDVEFSLGSLMRGEWRATELTVNGLSLDLGLDPKGRIDWPASQGTFDFASLAIDRLNLTGRIALHDAASRSTLELKDIAFSGDVRSLAGSIRGDGNFSLHGIRYPFRVSSGQTPDGSGTRVHLNIDPGQRALAADIEGVLAFDARAPRFEGAVSLATPAGQEPQDTGQEPWRVATRVKADYAGARLDQIEVNYGAEERALKLAGNGDFSFGASPVLRATLSARQLDADRFAAADNSAEPLRAVPALRALLSGIPQLPMPAQIELATEQVMLGGRPLQDISAELYNDARAWTVRRLEFRAPGATRVSLSGASTVGAPPGGFKAALNAQSSDPDVLMSWLQGRGDIAARSQKPFRLRGDVAVARGGFAIEAMKAEIDGGALEGRVAVSHRGANNGSRVDAELKAERLDLDAATAFVRSLAGPQAEWPDQGSLSLDIGRAVAAGQEPQPFAVKIGYDPNSVTLDQLKIGQSDSMLIEGGGNFDRVGLLGKLALESTLASPGQLAGVIAPFAPSVAARLNALPAGPRPLRAKLTIELTRNKAAPSGSAFVICELELDARQLTGRVHATATPPIDALRRSDLNAIGRSEVRIDARLLSEQGRTLLALLGLDNAIAASDGSAQFEASASGAWHAPLRLKGKVWGAGLDVDAEGSVEPWAADSKASVNLRIRSANISPLLDLKSPDAVQNIRLSSRVALAGRRLSFEDIDSTVAGSRLRGRVALTFDKEKGIEGEVGLDQITLAPIFAAVIGAAGHQATEPLGAGLVKGWRGQVTFQALHGVLPGGSELQPVNGTIKGDGQSVTFDALKGKLGGGEVTATIDARPGANGIAVNAAVQLNGVDGAALRYRSLSMPAGRASMQMTLLSQGRSAAALTGGLSGSGTVTLESARINGLDPRAFEAAIRASDSGQATDDAKLKQFVEPVLTAGALSIPAAQIAFNIRDGRVRVGATTLPGNGANAVVSGGYDIPADQADIRVALAPTTGPTTSRPEIQLFAVGTSDELSRTMDVAALSSWLAVRAIDRETRRLDAIERGEPPPMPAAIPLPSEAGPEAPDGATASAPAMPGPIRDPRRLPQHPRIGAPRPPLTPPAAIPPAPTPPSIVANQPQLAPLPPPIEIRPAPGAAKPRPRPPLALTPQVANPPPRPPLQNSN